MISNSKLFFIVTFVVIYLFQPYATYAKERPGHAVASLRTLSFIDPTPFANAILASSTLPFLGSATFSGASAQAAVFTQPLQGFPTNSGSFLVLSSGVAAQAPGVASTFASNFMFGVSGTSPDNLPAFDVATLTLTLNVPADARTLQFDFTFGTEENPSYLGIEVQDFFTATINNTTNIALFPNGSPMTVDNAAPFSNTVSGTSEVPTGELPSPNDVVYNAMLRAIRTASFDLVPYRGQSITIAFQIGDVSDDSYDSAVFIDNVRVERGASLSQSAAELAKLVVNGSYLGDGDTFGGKGWDPFQGKYVTPSEILSGYRYWNNKLDRHEFGAGVDCSGLIQWAFNRSFDPEKSLLQNVIRYDSADGQYKNNTTSIIENNLGVGDLLFLDKNNNGVIDHVAMFVGGDSASNVVEALSPQRGIIAVSKDDEFKERNGFFDDKSFRRITISPSIAGQFKAGSPIDLTVTDPEGFTITPETSIQTDEEFLREIPGELYYTESVLGQDGRPEDTVYWPTQKTGDYLVHITAEPDTLLTETYDLTFISDIGATTILAENLPIADIPSQPYIVRVSDDAVENIIPAKINIAPKTLNLGQKGLFSAIVEIEKGFGVSVADIDTETIAIEDVPTTRIMVKGKFIIAFFDTQQLQNVDTGDNIELKMSGKLKDGTAFEGSDMIRIISNGRFSVTSGHTAHLANVLAALQSALIQLRALLNI